MIEIFFIIILIIAIYLALFFFTPKKTIVYEMLRLPIYLVKALSIERNNMSIEKHHFGKHRRQYLLFFQAKNRPSQKKHVILFHHGGGWRTGSPEMFRANAQFFVDRGYDVFMPSYRRTPFNKYPEIREDISLGLQKAMAVLKSKQIQNKKIILTGMSAGGNLVALLLYNRLKLAELGYSQAIFGGVILLGAPLNLNLMSKTFMLKDFAGKHGTQLFKEANPINYLQENESIPVLGIHGTHDGLVSFKSAASFYYKMNTINSSILTFHKIENGTHLKTGSWLFENNDIRKKLLGWLDNRENN